MKGKLIVIEGVDGSGKQTQAEKLYARLLASQRSVRQVSYPRYEKESSAMVRLYLKGDFGQDADAVSPYVASTFYAADRYASYKEDYEDFYLGGGYVLADRYTTANMVHQAGKLADAGEREAFISWLKDYEYRLLGLPEPDLVFFLDVPPAVSRRLMADRPNKIDGGEQKDIHEQDEDFLRRSYENAVELAKQENWMIIDCTRDGAMRSIDEIHEEIYRIVEAL